MSVVIAGLDSFVNRVCAIDAATGKPIGGYVSIVAGKTSNRARQVEKISNWKNAEDLASQIEDVIEGLQEQYRVFGAYFCEENTGGEPSCTLKPWYYSKTYKEQELAPTVVDKVQENDKPGHRDLQAGALAQVTMDANRRIDKFIGDRDDMWLQIVDLTGENQALRTQIMIMKAVTGVEKWDKAGNMLNSVLSTMGPIVAENTKEALALGKALAEVLQAHYQSQNRPPAESTKPAEQSDVTIDDAIRVFVATADSDIEQFTLPRCILLYPVILKLEAHAKAKGWVEQDKKQEGSK